MVRSTLPADPPSAGPSGSFAAFSANLEKIVVFWPFGDSKLAKRTFGKKRRAFILSSSEIWLHFEN